MASLGKARQFSGSMRQTFAPHDHEDSEIAFDVREDEEQQVKYNETVELLLATGYFRARIKGLTPFDKVVGGMTWCITTCNFDVDVDLLFQENSTIGQKIALTEKIVAVLPKMKCPHRIEPHQIQGLDFIHIFPVIQWLVKKAIATREEMGDYIRAFSISQFDKQHQTPEDDRFEEMKENASSSVSALKKVHRPQRKYRRFDADKLTDEETRVQSTLLEYGRQLGISRLGKSSEGGEPSDKKKAVDAVLGSSGEEIDEEQHRKEEEKRIKTLMRGMSAMQGHEGKLTASAVGSIVELQSEQIQQIASEYADKPLGQQSELVQIERAERVGGAQQHKRVTATLRKQLEQQAKKLEVLEKSHVGLREANLTAQDKLKEVVEHGTRIDEEIAQLSEMETEANQSVLERLRSLVSMNESLKRQEQEFRAHCKEEMARLQGNIDKIKEESGETDDDTPETRKAIERQLEADKEKLHKIRLLMARKNREISVLQRKIDEVPSRAELGQYQRRFVELYNQMAAKHKETKQFYTLYNTLDDTKLYLNKEVNLLNSIHDNFEQAMSSQTTKEQFLKQFEQIVEGIKQNRIKVEKKKQGEKMKRDQLNDHYIDLVEKQRLYFKTVKDFKEECRKNEILIDKLRAR